MLAAVFVVAVGGCLTWALYGERVTAGHNQKLRDYRVLGDMSIRSAKGFTNFPIAPQMSASDHLRLLLQQQATAHTWLGKKHLVRPVL